MFNFIISDDTISVTSTAIEQEDRKETVSVCHRVMFSHKCKNVDAARVKGWRMCATVSRQSWCCNAKNSLKLARSNSHRHSMRNRQGLCSGEGDVSLRE